MDKIVDPKLDKSAHLGTPVATFKRLDSDRRTVQTECPLDGRLSVSICGSVLMPTLDFGQPETAIIQTAYVVSDIHQAMTQWTNNLGVGPWFLLDRFAGDDAIYRGAPAQSAVTLAMAFSGHIQIELLQPLDDHPSVYRETIQRQGYGFHHWGVGTRDLEGSIDSYLESGYELAFKAGVPTGGSVAFLDTKGKLPGFIELIELGDEMESTFTKFYTASLTWDGNDPVRPFG